MIDISCDQCGKDASRDYIYCEKCFNLLVDEINSLKDRIEELERQLQEKEA